MRAVLNRLVWMIPVILMACHENRNVALKEVMQQSEAGLSQEKHIGNNVVNMTYLPTCWEKVNDRNAETNDKEMCFKVNVTKVSKEQMNQQAVSYGVDTLFQLILNRDTLIPISAERIANGSLNSVEYLVIFERRPLAPVQQAAFIFKDWLFTSTRLLFPLDKKFLQKSDSLSCGL
ncbi:hypothetical protein DVR12_15525 [Chitinophaga silvatica]|uniref:Uncharacterized protein n=1 Tax=Chitinophaga silvatica TaxID=2282649 RepID=A0A3E1Y9I5_9BACT|nr:hypothetical protein [Chitinophaga silvatica]RFS22050.1 hypothetical protein DVR12_15525 [Chitinophaga silvatica]